MPVTITPPSSSTNHSRCSTGCASPSAQCIERSSRNLAIGLVNNMPDGALVATEQQFVSLLNAASGDFSISLSFYFLPEIPRSAAVQNHIDQNYRSVESLWDTELDGLIVTGKEPIAASLSDEPYWNSFVNLLEWARRKTCSTIWSCLAAHAAVLHMDGIQRVRNSQKHSGILDSTGVAEHPLMANLPTRFKLPHSRWNGLRDSDLISSGYQVLIQTDGAGADCFIKQEQSLFLFLQSHPEYQSETLLMEYRRDVIRFLRGETSMYPNMPRGYFDPETEQMLLDMQREVGTRSREDILAQLGAIQSSIKIKNSWHTTAETIYENWLHYISAEKKACMQKKRAELEALANVPLQVLLDPTALVSQ
jgi:homoserine O-succinyltransferase/O-acetyltransferase